MTTPIVIGIGGQKHSGKDTIASMLLYIHSVGPAAAKYNVWYEHYQNPKNLLRPPTSLACPHPKGNHYFDLHVHRLVLPVIELSMYLCGVCSQE